MKSWLTQKYSPSRFHRSFTLTEVPRNYQSFIKERTFELYNGEKLNPAVITGSAETLFTSKLEMEIVIEETENIS